MKTYVDKLRGCSEDDLRMMIKVEQQEIEIKKRDLSLMQDVLMEKIKSKGETS